MSRINKLFQEKKSGILSIFCTAGYPRAHSIVDILKSLQENGADLVEIGMPYSDPLADGPVIQESNAIALAQGMTITNMFNELKDFRKQVQLPVLLMGYLNPVLQYGFEKFCSDASATGIDGLIIPDLPEYEFEKNYQSITRKYGLDFIFLVTPETGESRVRKLDELSSGFLYAVSSSSTTGSTVESGSAGPYLMKLRDMQLKNPVLLGFGIHDALSFRAACQYASGAVIGSAYIKALKNSPDVNATTKSFLSSLLKG